MTPDSAPVIWFEDVGRGDVPRVGGKNASLGEMVGNLAARGVKVPLGLAWLGLAWLRHDGRGLLALRRC
jgi:pyruvate, water dikinase